MHKKIEQLLFRFPAKKKASEKISTISPANRELIEGVISAACQHFDVTREQLLGEYRLTNARHLCFYIIHNSTTGVFDYDIGGFFNKKRTAVQYGINLIDTHKVIYRQTLGDLNAIITIANSFVKKYEWHLQLNNTTP